MVPDVTTHDAVEPDTLLVIFHSNSLPNDSGKYKFTVTADADPCLGDPCHGVPCVKSANTSSTYSCKYPGL